MRRLILALALGAATLTAAAPSFAQPVPQRQENQEDRIRQGERSGELTRGETRSLQMRHRSIHRMAQRMRARDGGRLNGYQQHRLEVRQNGESRAIYRDKHNGRVD